MMVMMTHLHGPCVEGLKWHQNSRYNLHGLNLAPVPRVALPGGDGGTLDRPAAHPPHLPPHLAAVGGTAGEARAGFRDGGGGAIWLNPAPPSSRPRPSRTPRTCCGHDSSARSRSRRRLRSSPVLPLRPHPTCCGSGTVARLGSRQRLPDDGSAPLRGGAAPAGWRRCLPGGVPCDVGARLRQRNLRSPGPRLVGVLYWRGSGSGASKAVFLSGFFGSLVLAGAAPASAAQDLRFPVCLACRLPCPRGSVPGALVGCVPSSLVGLLASRRIRPGGMDMCSF
ncbi:uncharacterized protein LOC125553640 [Triticum urartu]|uniref:uncharacterized protein LOC125553640 n=1 Tax=Triticum urartu TaxID=4572 RepID=UPI0020442EFC|nr:uncharacterized protein LOC125553640 [Triticum urartu]